MTLHPRLFITIVPSEIEMMWFETIFWDEKYWIVPMWLENKTLKKRKPKRLILLDNLEHKKVAPGAEHHFVVNDPIPKDILFGQIPNKTKYQVIDDPDGILFDLREPGANPHLDS